MSSKSSKKRAAIEESIKLSELQVKKDERPARQVYRSASERNLFQRATTNLGEVLQDAWFSKER